VTDGLDRVKVYQASMSWDERWFLLDAFYRTGHFHWGYEGDFFGLYRDAYYGVNTDIYNADAPVGFEATMKRALSGLKVAFGPELWWGANPAVMLKYRRAIGGFDATALYEHDLARQTTFATSSTISLRPTRKATLHVKKNHGPFVIEAGGIWAGYNRVGEEFQVAARRGDTYDILRDSVRTEDTFGGKVKVSFTYGSLLGYVQAAQMGLVADGGPTSALTYTGWILKDTGSGNQRNVIGGLAWNVGRFQIGPNFLYQRPIVGPMPADPPSPGDLRNILDDPFAVRANREMQAAELLITYDPTPATWLWAWDNDLREDARFAGSIGYVFRHMPTTMDAATGILEDGVTPFAFERSTPARDLWELQGRAVSRLGPSLRVVAHAYVGTGEPNSDDPRRVDRFGGDIRVAGSDLVLTAAAKFNDWGPYDYHRDFNLTFPVQLTGDVSHTLGAPLWLDQHQTRIGMRGTWRSLDEYSPRYIGLAGDPNGNEWEIRTYLRLAM
jgi:beta-galactosidase